MLFRSKSVTDIGTGTYQVEFAIPFTSGNWAGLVTTGNDCFAQIRSYTNDVFEYPSPGGCQILITTHAGAAADKDWVWGVWFGELENE